MQKLGRRLDFARRKPKRYPQRRGRHPSRCKPSLAQAVNHLAEHRRIAAKPWTDDAHHPEVLSQSKLWINLPQRSQCPREVWQIVERQRHIEQLPTLCDIAKAYAVFRKDAQYHRSVARLDLDEIGRSGNCGRAALIWRCLGLGPDHRLFRRAMGLAGEDHNPRTLCPLDSLRV